MSESIPDQSQAVEQEVKHNETITVGNIKLNEPSDKGNKFAGQLCSYKVPEDRAIEISSEVKSAFDALTNVSKTANIKIRFGYNKRNRKNKKLLEIEIYCYSRAQQKIVLFESDEFGKQ